MPLHLGNAAIAGLRLGVLPVSRVMLGAQTVLAAPINTAAPTISGTAEPGEVLTAAPGSWSGVPAPSFAYQWQRDGSPIGSATASSYTLQSADAGAAVRVTVTATNALGSAAAASDPVLILPGNEAPVAEGVDLEFVVPAGAAGADPASYIGRTLRINGFTTSHSVTISGVSGVGRVAVVILSDGNDPRVTSCTIGGVTATLRQTAVAATLDVELTIWEADAPASDTVAWTTDVNGNDSAVAAFAVTGRTWHSGAGSAQNLSTGTFTLTTTAPAGASILAVHGAAASADNGTLAISGATQQAAEAVDQASWVVSLNASATGNDTITYTAPTTFVHRAQIAGVYA